MVIAISLMLRMRVLNRKARAGTVVLEGLSDFRYTL